MNGDSHECVTKIRRKVEDKLRKSDSRIILAIATLLEIDIEKVKEKEARREMAEKSQN